MKETINKIYMVMLCILLVILATYILCKQKKELLLLKQSNYTGEAQKSPDAPEVSEDQGYPGRPSDYIYANKSTGNMYSDLVDLRTDYSEPRVNNNNVIPKSSGNVYVDLTDPHYQAASVEDYNENLYSNHNFVFPKNTYGLADIDLTRDPINSNNFGNDYDFETAQNKYMAYYSPNNDGDYSIMKRTHDINRNVIEAQKTVMRYGPDPLRKFFEPELSANEKREWWDGSDLY